MPSGGRTVHSQVHWYFVFFLNYLILLIIAFKLNTLVSVHSFIMSNGVFQAGEQSMLLGLSGLLNLSTFILFFF